MIFPHIISLQLIIETRRTVCTVRIRGCHHIGRTKKRIKNLGCLDFSLILITRVKSEIQNWREDLLQEVRGVGLSFMLMRPKKAVEVRRGVARLRAVVLNESTWQPGQAALSFFARHRSYFSRRQRASPRCQSRASSRSLMAAGGRIVASSAAPGLALTPPLNLALNCSSPELYRSRRAAPLYLPST